MSRKTVRCILPALFVFLGASNLRADAKPDLSTPKQAAAAFATGLQRGDLAAIKNSTVGAPDDYQLINTMARMVGAANNSRGGRRALRS